MGYLQVSEEKLLAICSEDQVNEIRRNAIRLTRDEVSRPITDLDEPRSESDSTEDMVVITGQGEGIIRLAEESAETEWDASVADVLGRL